MKCWFHNFDVKWLADTYRFGSFWLREELGGFSLFSFIFDLLFCSAFELVSLQKPINPFTTFFSCIFWRLSERGFSCILSCFCKWTILLSEFHVVSTQDKIMTSCGQNKRNSICWKWLFDYIILHTERFDLCEFDNITTICNADFQNL